jgi:peptidoglycan/xylan/chitin deacetylase (PgdA/CDA1 family)
MASATAMAALGLGVFLQRSDERTANTEQATAHDAVNRALTPTNTTSPTIIPSPSPTSTITPSPTQPTPTVLPPMTTSITMAWHGNPAEHKVGITIDDFDHTPVIRDRLLDILSRNPDTKVTMFPIGRNVPLLNNDVPNMWRRLLESGHEIGYHSLEHKRLAGATVDALREEILQFNSLVGEVIGDPSFRVRFARAPFGDYGANPENFREVARELTIVWVLWQVIPIPTLAPSFWLEAPDSIQNGDIALFHDTWQETDYLEPYIRACREREFEMVTLSGLELFGD